MLLAAAISLGLLFLFPMWKIYVQAPQYPEGLQMHIWVNKISGSTDYSLQNFNILNHYIGMEKIQPDSFQELTYMPYIVFFFMLTGALIALAGARRLVLPWVFLLMVAGAAGLADFYMWLHKFGTNLDPHAPIIIPGMTYIPPFIGSKQLLNFHALSLPGPGSIGIALAVVLGLAVFFLERRRKGASIKSAEKTLVL